MSAKTDHAKTAAARKPTAAQRARAEKAAAQAKATAEAPLAPVAEAPVVEPPVEETGVVAIESAPSKRRAAAKATPAKAEEPTPSVPDLFRKGRTIAQIARTIAKGQDVVRAALDEAGVDYSADKNAKAVAAAKPATKTPAAPKEWTLLSSYRSILAKKVDAKSKRGRIVADLASGANTGDLVEIIASLASLSEGDAAKLAAGANALNAALSAHYARVS